MQQLTLEFSDPFQTFGQRQRLLDLLKKRPITCEDCAILGIAGSALPRRVKDLKDFYGIRIKITKKQILRKFDNIKVKISQYELE